MPLTFEVDPQTAFATIEGAPQKVIDRFAEALLPRFTLSVTLAAASTPGI